MRDSHQKLEKLITDMWQTQESRRTLDQQPNEEFNNSSQFVLNSMREMSSPKVSGFDFKVDFNKTMQLQQVSKLHVESPTGANSQTQSKEVVKRLDLSNIIDSENYDVCPTLSLSLERHSPMVSQANFTADLAHNFKKFSLSRFRKASEDKVDANNIEEHNMPTSDDSLNQMN